MKSFSRHKPDLLTAIYNGLGILFVRVFLPRNISKPQQLCYSDITPKTYRNGFFFKSQKSDTKVRDENLPSSWGCILLSLQKVILLDSTNVYLHGYFAYIVLRCNWALQLSFQKSYVQVTGTSYSGIKRKHFRTKTPTFIFHFLLCSLFCYSEGNKKSWKFLFTLLTNILLLSPQHKVALHCSEVRY